MINLKNPNSFRNNQQLFGRLMGASKFLFRMGVVSTACLLPLEILPNPIILIASALTTLALLQYGLLLLVVADYKKTAALSPWFILIAVIMVLPVASSLISTITAAYPSVAVRGTVSVLQLALRAWLIFQFSSKNELDLFEQTLIWIAAITVGFAFFQYVGDLIGLPTTVTHLIYNYSSHGTYAFPRVHSFAREPLLLANFLLLPIGILLFEQFAKPTGISRFKRLLLLLSLAIFWTTVARGAFLGLVIACIFVGYALRKQKAELISMVKVILISIALAFCLILVAGISRGKNDVGTFSHHALELNDKSFTNRTHLWPNSLKALQKNVLLGLGPGNSREFLDPSAAKNAVPNTKLPVFNNTFLTFMAEQGILGIFLITPLVVFCGIIGFKAFTKYWLGHSTGYAFALIGTAVQANTFEAYRLLRTWTVIAFLLVAWKLDHDRRGLKSSQGILKP